MQWETSERQEIGFFISRYVKSFCCVSVLYVGAARFPPAVQPCFQLLSLTDVKEKGDFLQCQESRVSENPKHQITYTSLFTVSIHS